MLRARGTCRRSEAALFLVEVPPPTPVCRLVGVIRGFSQVSSVFSGVLRGFVFGPASAAQSLDADRLQADRYHVGHSLPLLRRGHRVQTHDRSQGRSVRLSRLRPHCAPRRARMQMHMPPLLNAHTLWNSSTPEAAILIAP
jgi:hypothetical protein